MIDRSKVGVKLPDSGCGKGVTEGLASKGGGVGVNLGVAVGLILGVGEGLPVPDRTEGVGVEVALGVAVDLGVAEGVATKAGPS